MLPAEVLIIGGGVVGFSAARMSLGLGAIVYVNDVDQKRLEYIDQWSQGMKHTRYYKQWSLIETIKHADLVIGAILIPGAKAPKIVSEEMVKSMKKGSAIVDVAIDQGGCIETCNQISTHDHPIYERFGVLHYTVSNIPGAVPRTSTIALSNATLPYITKLTNQQMKDLVNDSHFLAGLNTYLID